MRKTTKDFLAIVVKHMDPHEPVYEFGSFQVAGQEGFADLRALFVGKKYVGVDMREGPGVDAIIDLHNIDLAAESVGTALCMETLEHVEYPQRALDELYRVLKPGGMVVISSGMDFPIHDHPHDYWRYTPEGFKTLLKPFENSFVGYAGKSEFPHTVVGIGFKGPQPVLDSFQADYKAWQARQESQFRDALKRFVPPVLVPLLGKVRRIAGLGGSSD